MIATRSEGKSPSSVAGAAVMTSTAIESIAPKIGCVPQTLLDWVKRHEIESGEREGVTTAEAQRVNELEREVEELRRANEILKLASAFSPRRSSTAV